MWTLLRTRRWLAFTLLVVVAIVGFGLLSRWQWERAEERRGQDRALQAETALDARPIGEALSDPAEWMPVTLTGVYAEDRTVLVRQRPLDGQNGFWVVTPMTQPDGSTHWVNRGWIRATLAATQAVAAPPPPEGIVSVVGRLRPAQQPDAVPPGDLPAGQVPGVDIELVGSDFYVERTSSDPGDPGVTALPLPEIDDGRNISYAVQWIIFAVIALVGWVYFLRREGQEDARQSAEDAAWTSD